MPTNYWIKSESYNKTDLLKVLDESTQCLISYCFSLWNNITLNKMCYV